MSILLRFLGRGKVDDIPAKDLTQDEIADLEQAYPEAENIAQILVDSGRYAWAHKYAPQKRGEHGSINR